MNSYGLISIETVSLSGRLPVDKAGLRANRAPQLSVPRLPAAALGPRPRLPGLLRAASCGAQAGQPLPRPTTGWARPREGPQAWHLQPSCPAGRALHPPRCGLCWLLWPWERTGSPRKGGLHMGGTLPKSRLPVPGAVMKGHLWAGALTPLLPP